MGGQAEYVLVPYADFNLLKFPAKEQALAKIRDLTMLSDILPTGFHGTVNAGVGVGSTVYVAGAGPVGMAAAACDSYRGPTGRQGVPEAHVIPCIDKIWSYASGVSSRRAGLARWRRMRTASIPTWLDAWVVSSFGLP